MNQKWSSFLLIAVISLAAGAASLFAFTQTNNTSVPGAAYECSGLKLDEVNAEFLTKEEQLALLDQALVDSVDRYSTCISAVQSSMSQGSGGGSGAGAGTGTGESEGKGQSGSSGSGDGATQSEDKFSDEAQTSAQEQAAANTTQDSPVIELPNANQTNKTDQTKDKTKRGVVPPKNNDAIICSMLFEAINSETNNVTKADLIIQYEDYECGR